MSAISYTVKHITIKGYYNEIFEKHEKILEHVEDNQDNCSCEYCEFTKKYQNEYPITFIKPTDYEKTIENIHKRENMLPCTGVFTYGEMIDMVEEFVRCEQYYESSIISTILSKMDLNTICLFYNEK